MNITMTKAKKKHAIPRAMAAATSPAIVVDESEIANTRDILEEKNLSMLAQSIGVIAHETKTSLQKIEPMEYHGTGIFSDETGESILHFDQFRSVPPTES